MLIGLLVLDTEEHSYVLSFIDQVDTSRIWGSATATIVEENAPLGHLREELKQSSCVLRAVLAKGLADVRVAIAYQPAGQSSEAFVVVRLTRHFDEAESSRLR